MKKILPSLFFLFLSTLNFAQVSIGAKAGLNYASFPEIESVTGFDVSTQPILAYHIGAIGEFALSERFAISTEILYSVKGSETNQLTVGLPFSQTFATGYISVPISGKLKFGKLGILGGLEPSFLVNERLKTDLTDWQQTSGLFNTIDFSLIGGLDLRFSKFYLAARYIHGLANSSTIVFTDENGQPLENTSWKNRVFQVSAGYFFLK